MKRSFVVLLAVAGVLSAAVADASAASNAIGAAYAITNSTAGNAVAAYARSSDGSLMPAGSVLTGGLGTGSGLESQGAVAISDEGRTLVYETYANNLVAGETVDMAAVVEPIAGLTPKDMATDIGVPFHKGAAKYYKEKGAL